jgi:hypothetical protein
VGKDRIRHPATISTFKRSGDRVSAAVGAFSWPPERARTRSSADEGPFRRLSRGGRSLR